MCAVCSFLILIWPPVLWDWVQPLAKRVNLSIRKHPSAAGFCRGRDAFQGSRNTIRVPTLGDGNQLYIRAFTIFLSRNRDAMSPTHKNSREYIYFLTDVVACYFKQLNESNLAHKPSSPTASLKANHINDFNCHCISGNYWTIIWMLPCFCCYYWLPSQRLLEAQLCPLHPRPLA